MVKRSKPTKKATPKKKGPSHNGQKGGPTTGRWLSPMEEAGLRAHLEEVVEESLALAEKEEGLTVDDQARSEVRVGVAITAILQFDDRLGDAALERRLDLITDALADGDIGPLEKALSILPNGGKRFFRDYLAGHITAAMDAPVSEARFFEFELALRDAPMHSSRRVRLLAEPDLTLLDLHRVIQAAAGWEDKHRCEFGHIDDASADGVKQVIAQRVLDDDAPPMDQPPLFDTVRVVDAFPRPQTLRYLYDFGDGWSLDVHFLGTVWRPHVVDAVLVEALGAFPPEDCGGPARFEVLLHAWTAQARGEPLDDEGRALLAWAGAWKPTPDIEAREEAVMQAGERFGEA